MLELAGRIVAVLVHRCTGYRYAEHADPEYQRRRERFTIRILRPAAPLVFRTFYRGIPIQR